MSYNPAWKRSERALGKWLMEHDGPDPAMSKVASSTGRVGHITELQYDVASLHYSAENKNEKVWAGLWRYWLQIVAKAIENGKSPLLRLDPTNEDRFVLGRRVPRMHIISEERHAELLGYERAFREMSPTVGQAAEAPVRAYPKSRQLRRRG